MSKKLSNKESEVHINQYYSNNSSMTITEFCRENNLSKQQFRYHKKRISEINDSNTTVFQGLKINVKEESSKKEAVNSEVRIIIRNATIAIPVSGVCQESCRINF